VPPLGLFQVQTFEGVYSVISDMFRLHKWFKQPRNNWRRTERFASTSLIILKSLVLPTKRARSTVMKKRLRFGNGVRSGQARQAIAAISDRGLRGNAPVLAFEEKA